MMSKLRDLYGLKYNPLTPDVPIDALLVTPRIADFLWRIEHGLCAEGGFAMIIGAPGLGKSVTGRLSARHLEGLRDVMVAPLQKPQSNVADFYRELGELFGVQLRPHLSSPQRHPRRHPRRPPGRRPRPRRRRPRPARARLT